MFCTGSTKPALNLTCLPSAAARERMRALPWERMFVADWERVLMLRFEVDPTTLQRAVPFQLDLYHRRAFVSLVAFSMQRLRPCFGGKLAELVFRPIATHDFLNVRTYVTHHDEPGIHFIAEWLSSRLAAILGPMTFGLPYRHGLIDYQPNGDRGILQGRVADGRTGEKFAFQAALHHPTVFQPCRAGSRDEWLMERYIAYNSAGGWQRSFRVWHPPWPQSPAGLVVVDNSLLTQNWPWFAEAKMVGANYSPGVKP